MSPIKGRAKWYAWLHSDFYKYLWSHDAGKVCHRDGYITQTTSPIYNEYMCSCWVSTLFRILCCLFSNCKIKTLLQNSYPYITFYMCCKSATFLCARTPRNEMKRSIEISLLVVFSFNNKLPFTTNAYVYALLWSEV